MHHIPIAAKGDPDRFIWLAEETAMVTVISTNYFLQEAEGEGVIRGLSTSHEINWSLWKMLWRSDCVPRIKHSRYA